MGLYKYLGTRKPKKSQKIKSNQSFISQDHVLQINHCYNLNTITTWAPNFLKKQKSLYYIF